MIHDRWVRISNWLWYLQLATLSFSLLLIPILGDSHIALFTAIMEDTLSLLLGLATFFVVYLLFVYFWWLLWLFLLHSSDGVKSKLGGFSCLFLLQFINNIRYFHAQFGFLMEIKPFLT